MEAADRKGPPHPNRAACTRIADDPGRLERYGARFGGVLLSVQGRPRRVGAEKSSTLCGLGVFVEEPAEPVMPDDFGIGVDGLGQRSQRAGLFQGPMWPVSIEMGLVFGKNHP